MSYTLQAFILQHPLPLTALANMYPQIQLPQGKTLLPLLSELREAYGVPDLPLTDERHQSLPESIESMGRLLSTGIRVTYVEAEIFGGVGTQACALFENGISISSVIVASDAINRALRFLGVAVGGDARDEFQALGLDRYRDTEDWRHAKTA
jgi:hypothetical protein